MAMGSPVADRPGHSQVARSASRCFDDGTLGAFLEGRLEAEKVAQIDAHAASCPACRELIAFGARVADSAGGTPRVGASILLAPSTARRVGATLKNKWRLDAVVGVGGMAEVYAGTHRNGKRVAVKILLPQLAVDPELCRRFIQEGYIANQIDHPNVVAVHDDDVTDDGAPFIVMDLLEGDSVADIIARGRMPAAESVRVACELLDALAAAHGKGILHRDVKPGNVFRTTSGAVKLLDFGIARVLDAAGATITGATMGTPAYMPQEQARGLHREVDARSDVWAAAATLFSMLTAAKVRDAETNNELLVMAVTQPVAPIRERAPWISAPLAAVIDKALSFEKADRFASAQEMARALRALPAEALEDPAVAATVPGQPPTYVPPTIATPPPASMSMTSVRTNPSGPASTLFRRRTGAGRPSNGPLILAGGAFSLAVLVVGVLVLLAPGPRHGLDGSTASRASDPTPPIASVGASPPSVTTADLPVAAERLAPSGPARAGVVVAGSSSSPSSPSGLRRPPRTAASAKPGALAPVTTSTSTPTATTPAGPKSSDPYDRRL